MNKALFLDLDWTVRGTKSGKLCPNDPKDQFILPRRKEVIKKFKDRGYKIIAVSNQGGVGVGHMTAEDNQKCLYDVNEKLDFMFDDMYSATAHPSEKHEDTKPNPGMILKAADKHNIDLSNSIMVGDRDSDKQAAKNAKVASYFTAQSFFGDRKKWEPNGGS